MCLTLVSSPRPGFLFRRGPENATVIWTPSLALLASTATLLLSVITHSKGFYQLGQTGKGNLETMVSRLQRLERPPCRTILTKLSFSHQASPAIAPPTSFFWSTPDLRMGDFSIPACSSVQIITFPNPGTSVAPAPPFTFLAFPVGGIVSYDLLFVEFNTRTDMVRTLCQAETQSTSMKLGDGFNWTANFPEVTLPEKGPSQLPS